MRSNSLSRTVILCLALAAAWACAPKRRLVSSGISGNEVSGVERREVLGHVDRHRLVFATFSGRAKGRVVLNKDDYDLTANVRIQRDSAIWISVTALMGIEAGRIMITPDSIKLVNRLRSEYAVKAFDYVHRFTNDRLDFHDLQALLLGNVPQSVLDEIQVWASDNGHVLRSEADGVRWEIRIDADSRPAQTKMENDLYQRLETTYGNYRGEAGRLFPHRLAISLSADGLDLRSEMNFTRVSFDDVAEMPFSIPSTYREIQ